MLQEKPLLGIWFIMMYSSLEEQLFIKEKLRKCRLVKVKPLQLPYLFTSMHLQEMVYTQLPSMTTWLAEIVLGWHLFSNFTDLKQNVLITTSLILQEEEWLMLLILPTEQIMSLVLIIYVIIWLIHLTNQYNVLIIMQLWMRWILCLLMMLVPH